MNGAAHDEMMVAPAVITALPIAGKGAAKITARESRDALSETGIAVERANLVHGGLEGVHALAEFREEI